MSPDIDTQAVMVLLRDLGLRADPIPESSIHKTPDLKVACSPGDVLIEVKSKEDDKRLRELLNAPHGTVHPGPSPVLASRVKEAWHQIHDYPERTDANFTVVWFIAHKPHSITVLTGQFIVPILYGTRLLEGRTGGGQHYEKPCFFLNRAMFARYKELDAVVVHDDQTLQLCLNPLSGRYPTLRNTHLAKAFDTHFTVVDPPRMENAGTCFIADPLSEGETTNDAVRRLKSKYDLDTLTICTYVPFNDPVE